MRIAIDARPVSHPQSGGFKSYTDQLLRALARVDERNEYVLYLDRAVCPDTPPCASNFNPKILRSPIPSLGVVWREQVLLPRACAQDHVALAHLTANTSAFLLACPTVVTLHDIIFWDERPSRRGISLAQLLKRWGMFLYGRAAAQASLVRAQRIITVSEYSKREIVQRFGIASERVDVIYNGVSERFQPISDTTRLEQVRRRFQLAKPFVLGITSASPRKNAAGLLQAYRALASEIQNEYDLVLVWTHGLWREHIAKQVEMQGLNSHVKFISQVEDDDLVSLMNLAALFVFPSLAEGFGLPPLEAMRCGTPVVASNRSGLPQVLGDAALLADPLDAHAFAQAMTAVLQNPALAADLKARGEKWSARYSWERCARETLAVYQDAVRESP